MTHMCVSATARAALDLGYQSTVLSDASATRDLPDIDGAGTVPAAEIHRIELAALADRFAIVLPHGGCDRLNPCPTFFSNCVPRKFPRACSARRPATCASW